jgi:tRNA 2-thiouridine synthesizing protein A
VPGRMLLVTATDAMAAIDIPLMCRQDGHALIESRRQGGVGRFLIRRG